MIKKKPIEINQKPTRRGQRTIKNKKIVDSELYKAIRKRLKVKQKELPRRRVEKLIALISLEINTWLVENPEGFRMPYQMGFLALSKYVLIPFREDRWEIVNRIKNLSSDAISDRFREIVMKKYGRQLTREEAMFFIKQGKVTLIPMWFNKRNCSVKKAMCYKWMCSKDLKAKMRKADKTKFYYYNFSDFNEAKIRALD